MVCTNTKWTIFINMLEPNDLDFHPTNNAKDKAASLIVADLILAWTDKPSANRHCRQRCKRTKQNG